ncbi:diguanylate cyclase [Pacificispira sp.]|uniref:diguanylate cyclase n=1 Tax=Pacificispira sp. TaxID=2888761 RepID=UPI003BAC58C7
MADQNKTDARIDALLERLDQVTPELQAEVEWLVGRYRRLDRNLDKISRMSDRMQAQILDLNDQLRAASITDPLTGMANRRGAHDALIAETRAYLEADLPFCVALFDIDHFKAVNDTHGHDVGDEVLVDFAARLSGAMRDRDMIARWGGEEFLVLMPETGMDDASILLEGFLEMLRARPIKTANGPLRITASAGLCRYIPSDEGYDRTVYRADQALYAAKTAGRDRWVMAEES